MSNNKSNYIDLSFESFGGALEKVLNDRRLSKTWLAKELHAEGHKPSLSSLQSMISRWSRGEEVSLSYQKKINSLFDFEIKQNANGKWIISRTTRKPGGDKNSIPVTELNNSKSKIDEKLEQKGNQLQSLLGAQGASGKERDVLLEYLRGRAESLSQELQDLADGLQKLQDLDNDRSDNSQ